MTTPPDPSRPAATTVAEIAERVGQLRARHGPSGAEVPLTYAEAVQQLTDQGFDPAGAQAMVTGYLHETSRAVGVPVYEWGLDGHDVDAVAAQYAWVHDGNGQTLAQARERAAGRVRYWAEQSAAVDPERHPREAEQAAGLARQWAQRARVPEPFNPPGAKYEHEPWAVERADAATADGERERWAEQAREGRRGSGAVVGRASGDVVIPEQVRREQLVRWHAEDQAGDTVNAEQVDGAPLDLGRG